MSFFNADFYVSTARIRLAVPHHSAGAGLVETSRYRPFLCLSFPTKEDWLNDTKFLCAELGKTSLDSMDDYKATLGKICTKHISQYGRIIDSDLYNYIDELVLIIAGIAALGGPPFTQELGLSIWKDFQSYVFDKYYDHIWMNQFSRNPAQKTMLVPLKDFNAFL